MGANILLFVCTNILGAIDYYIADRKQRRSVLETRQSLEVKITLESENLQQVCTSIYSKTCTICECVSAQKDMLYSFSSKIAEQRVVFLVLYLAFSNICTQTYPNINFKKMFSAWIFISVKPFDYFTRSFRLITTLLSLDKERGTASRGVNHALLDFHVFFWLIK